METFFLVAPTSVMPTQILLFGNGACSWQGVGGTLVDNLTFCPNTMKTLREDEQDSEER